MNWRQPTVLLASMLLLHAAASVPYPWSFAALGAAMLRPSPDLAALLGLALLGGAAGRPRWSAQVAALLLLVAIAFRVADGNMQTHHARPFDLADLGDLGALDHLLLHDAPRWLQVTALAALGLGVVAVHQALAWAFARLALAAARPRWLLGAAAVLQAVVLAGVARQSLQPRAATWHPSALAAAARQGLHRLAAWLLPDTVDGPIRAAIAAGQARLAAAPADLGGLAGADVHVLFVESYGCFALRHPELAGPLRALWDELGAELRGAGFAMRTRACRPSIYGGFSWLAHAEFYSGVPVPDRRTWELLHESDLVPLPRFFRAAGYRTAEVLPVMHIHWPAGQRFHGFDEEVTQLELGYQGARYHFGQMPDQWALHWLLERIVKPATQPLFTVFASATSHAPFSTIPPYVADWRIDERTFAGPPRIARDIAIVDMLGHRDILPAYRDAIEYALRCAVGFTVRLTRPSLVIVLGDHQPPIARLLPSDAGFDVPMHVIANRPELLVPFAAAGFGEGATEPAGAPSFPTHEFATLFLRGFARPAGR